jgi:hypothetical protein
MARVLPRPGVASDARFILAAYLLSRLVVFAVMATVLAIAPEMGEDGKLAPLCRWDCYWYLGVAEDGYDAVARHWGTGSGANWAFFPALPLVIRLSHAVTGLNWNLAAILATQAIYLGSLFLFHAYAREIAPAGRPEFPRYATLVLVLWPYSIYFASPMSEALFLPLSVAVLLLVRRDHWVAAGLVGALLTSSRIVGVLVAPVMLALAVRQFGWHALLTLKPGTERPLLAIALSGIGISLFALHQHTVTGDSLAFLHGQVAWGREFKWPWMMLIDELNPFLVEGERLAINAYYALVVAAALALLVVLWRRGLGAEFLFALMVTAVALTGGRLISLPRVLGAIFPFVLALALLGTTPLRRRWIVIASTLCQIAVLFVLFLEAKIGIWSELAM